MFAAAAERERERERKMANTRSKIINLHSAEESAAMTQHDRQHTDLSARFAAPLRVSILLKNKNENDALDNHASHVDAFRKPTARCEKHASGCNLSRA
mmetsp:Transcript_1954/g.6097  ORF Transcript_1954/g.6097 Transcript_1954/m.6097 type:complete len:98 (-) Transcript_1954:988-1281(-)